MYKSKLQELCHKQKWGLPKYTCVKDGEDHCPMFKASVVVSGTTFNSPPALTSSKQAYNEAAQLAFLHFTSEPSSEETEYVEKTNGEIKTESSVKSEGMTVKRCENLDPSDQKSEYTEKKNSEKEVQSSVKSEDMTEKYRDNIDFHDEFKKKLQIYAKNKNLDLIVYRIEKEGGCYKARVSIGEDWFESEQLSETAEEAENAAAQSALLSLSTDAFNENDPHSYKILLQELADKEGFFPPKYTTTVPRDSRIQTFSSTVEVEGEVFQGDTAKSKKLAELNAAKAAYTVFTERKLFNPGYFSPMSSGDDIIELAPRLESVIISDKKENPISGSPSNFSSGKKHETEEQDNTGESEEIVYRTPDSTTTKKTNEIESYLLCNRVKVFTSIPNMALPRGTVVLPISENRWTVVNLEFPSEKGI
ncbi:hypothetical protein ABFS82_14G226800 [Erythranthe guttata]|uniref:double-stranded RNA-binding protein 1-like n=1 Tax=Erythranthe guttata TaxID=4155 RepID=UPI00064DFF05|nr:PREDICTED: double-stranded RNA-binding protein 1-like [Erythranthe guttata]|eukprot:XP_012838483.1 PREDICTED: double-stranded RNA-binding protein 1-like [Erythranthe guttata]